MQHCEFDLRAGHHWCSTRAPSLALFAQSVRALTRCNRDVRHLYSAHELCDHALASVGEANVEIDITSVAMNFTNLIQLKFRLNFGNAEAIKWPSGSPIHETLIAILQISGWGTQWCTPFHSSDALHSHKSKTRKCLISFRKMGAQKVRRTKALSKIDGWARGRSDVLCCRQNTGSNATQWRSTCKGSS